MLFRKPTLGHLIFMPNLCKKEKGNVKNFNLKKNSNFFWIKIFFENFFEIFFFALNHPKKGFKAENFFSKNFKKKFMIQFFYFFQIEIFFISLFFFAKVRHEYQMSKCGLFKKHQFRSICLTVLPQ